MRKTFVLLFKDSLTIKTYTSLKGIFEEYNREQLGVSIYTLQRRDLTDSFYENNKIRIEISLTQTPGEIRRKRR